MKKVLPLFIALSLGIGLCLTGCEPQEKRDRMVLNLPKVINHTMAQVKRKMGTPDSVYRATGARGLGDVFEYRKHDMLLYFYDDILKEVYIRDPEPMPFSVNYIKYLGILPENPPDYMMDSLVISWGNIPDYNEVKMFCQTRDSSGTFDYHVWVSAK